MTYRAASCMMPPRSSAPIQILVSVVPVRAVNFCWTRIRRLWRSVIADLQLRKRPPVPRFSPGLVHDAQRRKGTRTTGPGSPHLQAGLARPVRTSSLPLAAGPRARLWHWDRIMGNWLCRRTSRLPCGGNRSVAHPAGMCAAKLPFFRRWRRVWVDVWFQIRLYPRTGHGWVDQRLGHPAGTGICKPQRWGSHWAAGIWNGIQVRRRHFDQDASYCNMAAKVERG